MRILTTSEREGLSLLLDTYHQLEQRIWLAFAGAGPTWTCTSAAGVMYRDLPCRGKSAGPRAQPYGPAELDSAGELAGTQD